MDIQNATARLRRTFAYPSDSHHPDHNDNGASDDDDGGVALDEQEQDELIASLVAQNARRNAQFQLFLLALPAVSALPYLAALLGVGGGSSSGRPLVAALALSSLASTAWMLWALPPGATGIASLDAWVAGGNNAGNSNIAGVQQLRSLARGSSSSLPTTSASAAVAASKSPLEQYLPYLNLGLCAVLVLTGFLGGPSAATSGHWGHVGLGNLPAIVYAVVLLAKVVMGGIDPERELSGLRYEYKGA